MAQPDVIPRMTPSRVIEGTAKEIAAHLEHLGSDKRLTLIVPGDSLPTVAEPEGEATDSPMGKTFAEILAPLQEDFEATGMTEEKLDEFIDQQVRQAREELDAGEREGDDSSPGVAE